MNRAPRTTVAAIVEQDGRFLLVEEETGDGRVLNQPAGHVEHNESLIAAVIRETLEETAWTFHPKGLVGVYQWRLRLGTPSFFRFCFWGELTARLENRALDPDILRTLWLTRNEIADPSRILRTPMVTRCIDDFINGKRFSLDILNEVF